MACCCGPRFCDCPSSQVASAPTYFNVSFSNFTVSLHSVLAGNPSDHSALIKQRLEGLSPMIFPLRSQTSTSFTYERKLCSEFGTNCNVYPPGFVAVEAFNNQLHSTMRMGLFCNGQAAQIEWFSSPLAATAWRILNDGFTFPTTRIWLTFPDRVVFTASDICQPLATQTATATLVPSRLSGDTIVSFTQAVTSPNNGAGYSGTGTVTLEPIYNPLP